MVLVGCPLLEKQLPVAEYKYRDRPVADVALVRLEFADRCRLAVCIEGDNDFARVGRTRSLPHTGRCSRH